MLKKKEALEKWGEADLNKHVESGRVTYRETTTWRVYEYCDTQDWEKTTSAKHANQWVEAQEYQQNEDEEEEWETQMNKDLMSLLNEFTPGKGKSSGKGKNSDKTPGKGKAGKGAGKARRSKGGDRNTPWVQGGLLDWTYPEPRALITIKENHVFFNCFF